MDLTDLRIFAAVVEAGGITRAAEKLHRVQSNVTTRIRQLEDDLQVQLFVRQGKRLHLSAAGRILLDYAERLLSLAAEAETAVRDRRPRGTFRLGSMESTAAVRLPGPLARFSREYSDVKLELRTGNPGQLAAALLNGELDAALVAEPVAAEKFDQLAVFDEEVAIVTAASYPPIDEPHGTPEAMIVFEHGCPHRRLLEAWYRGRGGVVVRTIELASYHAMLGCVLAGMGAALIPVSVLGSFEDRDLLRLHALPAGQKPAANVADLASRGNDPQCRGIGGNTRFNLTVIHRRRRRRRQNRRLRRHHHPSSNRTRPQY